MSAKRRPKKSDEPGSVRTGGQLRNTISIIALVVVTLIVYGGAVRNGLLNWDDNFYITESAFLRDLSWNGIKNIFGAYLVGNYHPFTLLSYALEYAVGGRVDPALMHTTNIVLHAINTVLVFFLGRRLLNHHWGGVLVALIFALHPMHVESVAWIAERKDVLYTCFFCLSLLCYLRYIDAGDRKMYVAALLFFICSLLSKSAAAALAPLLFAVDHLRGRSISVRSVAEKLPFLGLAVVFGLVALSSQAGAMEESFAPHFPWSQRPIIVLYALAFYTVHFFIPHGLSAIHPYPVEPGEPITALVGPAVGVVLVLGSLLFIAYRDRANWRIVSGGLLFYVITLAMVLQFFPVGRAIVAERYTYVPYIGLSLIVVKFCLDTWCSTSGSGLRPARLPLILLALSLFVFAGLTVRRISVWENSYTLFADMLEQYPEDGLIHYNRGLTRFYDKDHRGSIKDYDACVRYKPDCAPCYFNRGLAYKELGDMDAVIRDMGQALRLEPDYADAFRNRGNARAMKQDYAGSIEDFTRALSHTPNDTNVLTNRGLSHYLQQDTELACDDWRKAARAGSRKAAGLVRDQCSAR